MIRKNIINTAIKSTCLKRHVGSIIVKDNIVLSTGFNGTDNNICKSKQCLRLNSLSGHDLNLCRGIHAEQAAISKAAKEGIAIKGATLHVTHKPCSNCAKLIIQSGISKVIYYNDYPDIDNLTDDILKAIPVIYKSSGVV